MNRVPGAVCQTGHRVSDKEAHHDGDENEAVHERDRSPFDVTRVRRVVPARCLHHVACHRMSGTRNESWCPPPSVGCSNETETTIDVTLPSRCYLS